MLLGRVVRLQVQREMLRRGQKPHRVYDPAPLLGVERLRVSRGGAVGIDVDGSEVIDVHHASHARSKNSGHNAVSIGFTSHYAEMRALFGDHLEDGCAGENVLVSCERRIRRGDLESVAVESDAGGRVVLRDVRVARPCSEFSHYALRTPAPAPPERLKAALQSLDGGTRGFYTTPAVAGGSVEIRVGARVFVGEDG
jgi:hypothetical protein